MDKNEKHFNTTIQQEITTMKTIRVVAAIILADNKIFATQRGYGDLKTAGNSPVERSNQMKRQNMPS